MKQVDHIINERTILKFLTEHNAEHLERDQLEQVCPFIIQFYSSFQDNDKLYFELEYVQGCSLISQIRSTNQLIQKNMVFYASETLLTLKFLHGLGIIYRDLKPENMVLSMNERGHLKLVDFGFAKRIHGKQ